MKLITVLSLILLAQFAFANQSVQLNSSDEKLSLLKSGLILSVDQDFGNCPPNAMCMPRSVIRVNFTLKGCLDRLGPVTALVKHIRGTNEYELHMTAVNIHNKRSRSARCIIPRTQIVEVTASSGVNANNLRLVMNASNLVKAEVREPRGPRACTAQYDPVCGVPKNNCDPGRVCMQVIPAPGKTFSNMCQLRQAGAKFLHSGKCHHDQ